MIDIRSRTKILEPIMVELDNGQRVNLHDRRLFNKVVNSDLLYEKIANADLKGFYKKLVAFNHLLITCDSVKVTKSITKDEKRAILDRLNDLSKTIETLPVEG